MTDHLVWVEVDLDAIGHNFTSLQKMAEPAAVMAVVKSFAYGHGLVPVAKRVAERGARAFCVASMDEAVALREAGIMGEILVICPVRIDEAALAIRHDIIVAVFDLESATAMGRVARDAGGRLKVHAKIDTGLGRLSVLADEGLAFVQALASVDGIAVDGIYSHLADAEGLDQSMTLRQHARFEQVFNEVVQAGVTVRCRHIAGSAAALLIPRLRYDYVRVGVALYGLWPSEETHLLMLAGAHSLTELLADADAQSRGVRALSSLLRPALQLKARVVQIKEVPTGWTVGYGCTYRTRRPTRVAVLPLGYADGYDRGFSNCGEVLIRGRRAPVIGRVCMNLTMVDVTDIPEANVSDEAVLIGRQGGDELTAEAVAATIGTIHYELVTRIRWDLPRVYTEGAGD
ncbi:MAG: alanine racemase [Proteobacteria bacterium]|nr:alanine racemase [Pseudomonadota bacterium]